MRQRQMISEAITSSLSLLKPGDSFTFTQAIQDNCVEVFMLIDEFEEGTGMPNAVGLSDGQQYRFDTDSVVVPLESEVVWRVKISK
ncbi:hypothetical protein [Serratia phage SMP]|jgi:hypothetical protein|uniref:Uncharacterized protein n=1 Tax=Serratia phage SMP TaxID=2982904 RepID=A0A9E8G789_9CAUD|nr:hypothetical protein [Serratia phage SMP]